MMKNWTISENTWFSNDKSFKHNPLWSLFNLLGIDAETSDGGRTIHHTAVMICFLLTFFQIKIF